MILKNWRACLNLPLCESLAAIVGQGQNAQLIILRGFFEDGRNCPNSKARLQALFRGVANEVLGWIDVS